MSINRMYYGTKKIYSFLENGNSGGNTGGDCPQINLGEEWIIIGSESSGVVYELNPQDNGYDGYSKVTVEVEDLGNPEVTIRNAQEIVDGVNDGWYEITENKVFVKGQITEIQRIRPDYGDARYTIDGCFNVYNGYYNDEIQIGDYVVVEGVVSLYNGTVQFSAGSSIKVQFRCQGGSSEGGVNPFVEYGYNEEDVTNISSINKGNSLAKLNEWDSSRDSTIEYFLEDEYETPSYQRLVFAPMLDTSNVTNMSRMFKGTASLVYVPLYDTSKVESMRGMFEHSGIMFMPKFDTSNVRDVIGFCAETTRLVSMPKFDFSNVVEIGEFFGYWNSVMSLVNLGGFEGLKIDWNDGWGLNNCPYLTYESIMNVINGLYDFRGNGDNDTIKTLKIHTNTMALLSDEDKQIATNKGWMLTE